MSNEDPNNELNETTTILMVKLVDNTVYTFPYSSVDLALENAELLVKAFEEDEFFSEVTVAEVDMDMPILDVFTVKH